MEIFKFPSIIVLLFLYSAAIMFSIKYNKTSENQRNNYNEAVTQRKPFINCFIKLNSSI
ncbi:hypothetical protein M2105_000965 [Paenibacillus sp. PastF-1]|nr:hypothetical protein [Paenibacillus sp. PastF-2]MDF9846529.1 hypothetical protein [Paenibacillus sp. PastM-2]MDF9853123.1 hypothetical protein [Paenibacillus sp. PastF-1]MDH6478373.1 hypothetical protein [Paenibacillus sp. PastH-2]MDH6506129.1 hypothetical protein [Paenibacillus sp. PastM-3]